MAVNNYGEKELFEYIQYLRLSCDKKLNDENIADNTKIEGDYLNNFRKSISNFIHGYDKKTSPIDNNLAAFTEKHPNVMHQDKAKETLLSLFISDTNGITKLLFGIKVILDTEYKYNYESQGLGEASLFIFNDYNKLLFIKNDLERSYKKIAQVGLSDTQKKVMTGIVICSIATSVLIPILGVGGLGASASASTAALAAKGFGDMQLGVGMLGLSSVLCSAAIIGGTYLAMDLYNKKKVKDFFRKMNPDELFMYLATQCVVINHLKTRLPKDDFKNELDSIIKSVDELKSDLDYFLFIEQENVKDNERKLKGFHGFDERLGEILLAFAK